MASPRRTVYSHQAANFRLVGLADKWLSRSATTPEKPTESATFDHLPLYEDGLPTDGLLNKSVQLAQDHTGHEDIDGYYNNIVQDAHRFLTRFGDGTSPHVLTIQKLGFGATGQRERFGAMFRFKNHIVRKHAYLLGVAMEYRPVPLSGPGSR